TVVSVMPLPALDAAALFRARARQLRPQLRLQEAEEADIAAICSILGGLPLAVELAAARAGVLSIARIRQRLSDRFRLLQSRHSLTPRQSTLRTTIDWSWQLLEPWEQSALAQCSAFAGAFSIEDAEGVLELEAWEDAPWPMDVVQSLLDRCLLRPGSQTSDEPTFQMYASVQEYASEKLGSDGTFVGSGPGMQADTWRRHGAHFAALGSPEALMLLSGTDGLARRQHLNSALDNLLVAARRALQRQDASTASPCSLAASEALIRTGAGTQAAALTAAVAALPLLSDVDRASLLRRTGEAWLSHRRLNKAAPFLEEALLLAPAGSRAEGLARSLRARLAVYQNRLEDARADYVAVLQLNVTLQDSVLETLGQAGLGWLEYRHGEPTLAIRHYEEALRLSRARGDQAAEADALTGLGRLDQLQGRAEQAIERFAQALQVSVALQDVFAEGMLNSQLSFLCRLRSDLPQATMHIQHALRLARSHGDRAREGIFCTTYGAILGDAGRSEEALAVLEEALSIHREMGSLRDQARTLSLIGARRAQMDQLSAALTSYGEARTLLQQLNDRWGEGQNLGELARTHRRIGDLTSAEQYYLEALVITRELKFRRHEGLTLNNLGNLLLDLGRLDEARQHFEDSLTIQKRDGVRQLEALPISGLAMAAEIAGDLDTAAARYDEALQIALEVGNSLYIGWLRSSQGWVAHRQERLLAAREHYEAAAELLGRSHAPGYSAVLESRRALLLAQTGQSEAALSTIGAASALIADVQVPAERLEVLCNQIGLLRRLNHPTARLLSEADTLCEGVGLSPRSLLGQRLAALHTGA
ncbi:MAG: tetratricopeptide (TPR) repeat protein, partial [Myxococcota bacterium]